MALYYSYYGKHHGLWGHAAVAYGVGAIPFVLPRESLRSPCELHQLTRSCFSVYNRRAPFRSLRSLGSSPPLLRHENTGGLGGVPQFPISPEEVDT